MELHNPAPSPCSSRTGGELSQLSARVFGSQEAHSAIAEEAPQDEAALQVRRWKWVSLDCYWVGSFDFNFLGNKGVFYKAPQKLNFLQGVNSNQVSCLHFLLFFHPWVGGWVVGAFYMALACSQGSCSGEAGWLGRFTWLLLVRKARAQALELGRNELNMFGDGLLRWKPQGGWAFHFPDPLCNTQF